MCPTTLGTGVRGRIAEQQHKNTARHIVGSLQTWDLNPDLAARRWVWELLQNAADTATANHRQLTLTFTLTPNSLTFEHNGGPFRDQDLAALILAGSAKPLTIHFMSAVLVPGCWLPMRSRSTCWCRARQKDIPAGFRSRLIEGDPRMRFVRKLTTATTNWIKSSQRPRSSRDLNTKICIRRDTRLLPRGSAY